jgi:phosphate butyryltransferase
MKGGVDTSTMMKTVLKEDSGLRQGRLLSDIFILEYPERSDNKFVMITDGGMTLAPDLRNKVELIRNAVDVAHALGNLNPKVAVLSATEFVVHNLPSTLDAAALAKMNERGQIKGCVVDGPLALDNALSREAAAEKGIKSVVAGQAEILVAANIESANSLAKSTTYFASLPLAHVVVGASVPILIPSRADKRDAKLFSIALGMVMSEFYDRNGVD